MSLAREALAAYFSGRFSRHPHHAVSVWISTDVASYQAFCRKRLGSGCPENDLGLYDRFTREIFRVSSRPRRRLRVQAPGVGRASSHGAIIRV